MPSSALVSSIQYDWPFLWRDVTLRVWGLVLCLALTSCVLPARRAGITLGVSVAADANQHLPIPVDVVVVWDKALAGKIGEMTAKDWFAKKPQIVRDDPDEKTVTVIEREWVPGQAVSDLEWPEPVAAARKWVRGVFVFANYKTEGPHRLSLKPGTAGTLELERDGMRLRLDAATRGTRQATAEKGQP